MNGTEVKSVKNEEDENGMEKKPVDIKMEVCVDIYMKIVVTG